MSLIDPVTGDEVVDVLDMIHPSLLKQKCLDHGFVNLLDSMPRLVPLGSRNCDFALADAARISYQKGTRKLNEDAGLVDYLIRNKHTSPIEMGELKFHIRLPIFVMRQLVRHRTASLNEESARYSVLASDFYVPRQEDWAANTPTNKQATVRGAVTDPELAKFLHDRLTMHNGVSYQLYQLLLGEREDESVNDEEADYWDQLGVPSIAREQARMVLGTNIYTQCIWKQDLKNLLHLTQLRTDPHAQWEIREFGDAIARVNEALFPAAWKSWKDNVIDGVSISRTEGEIITMMLAEKPQHTANFIKALGWSKRRGEEFFKKLKKAPWVPEALAGAVAVHFTEQFKKV